MSLPPDNGLFMPDKIPALSPAFIKNINDYSLPEIAFEISKAFMGDDIPENILDRKSVV